MSYEKIFEEDKMSKRERVERALNFKPLDRAAIHEQLSYNPRVLSKILGKDIKGYTYTLQDIGTAIRKTLDATFPLFAPIGTGIEVSEEGFIYKLDNWTKWRVGRPFTDELGAKEWLKKRIRNYINRVRSFDKKKEKIIFQRYIMDMQKLVGETVVIDDRVISTGFCEIFDLMGLEIFTYFYYDNPQVMKDYMEVSGELAVKKVIAAGDNSITPVAWIAEDFCTKQGPIFSPEILEAVHYPYVKQLADAWHDKGLKVIYHTDGNFKKVIPDLLNCGVNGFYCLERQCGMNIEELVREWPGVFWAGGVDGVNTMEYGTPSDVKNEVFQILNETNALTKGGIFIDTSSEINPTIPPENFMAMLEAVNEKRNKYFL